MSKLIIETLRDLVEAADNGDAISDRTWAKAQAVVEQAQGGMFYVSQEQANQLTAALRVFQAVRHHGGAFRDLDGSMTTISEMEHFEETNQPSDSEIEGLCTAIFDGVEAPEPKAKGRPTPKHSPGPWPELDEVEQLAFEIHRKDAMRRGVAFSDDTVAANAAVLRAAPVMLEALRSVEAAYGSMFDVMPVAWQTYDTIVSQAIDAAEGRS